MTEKPPVAEGTGNSKKAAAPASKKPRKSRLKNSTRGTSVKSGRKAGGRPPWQPSIEDRVAVEQMKFVGESDAMIARALKVDVDTMRKHCAYELENGYANQRRRVTKLMFEAADKGNAAAIKRLDEMGRASAAASRIGERGTKKPDAAPKAPKLGKKEQQQIDAAKVGGKFATPEPPKLVVDNSAAAGGQ